MSLDDYKGLLTSFLKIFQLNSRTKKGLFVLLLIEAFLIFIFPLNRFKGILDAPEELSFFINIISIIFEYLAWSKIVFFILLALVSISVWLFKSGRFVFISKKIKVAIALDNENLAAKSILKKSLYKTKRKLDSLNLLDNFKIFQIGTDLFNTNEQAQKYVTKKNLNLVIHGNISLEKTNSKNIFSMKDFSFSYTYYSNSANPDLSNMIKSDINLILAHRNWTIEEDNSSVGLENISKNFVEVIVSLVAISIISKKEYLNTSLCLIENLLPFMERNVKNSKIIINPKKKYARIPIELLKTTRLKTILLSSYSYLGDIKVKEKDYQSAIAITEKSLKFGSDKLFCYRRFAYCYYLLGDIEKSKLYTEKLNAIKSNTPTYIVNKAFFSILDNNHQETINLYDSLKNKKTNDEFVSNIIEFLSDQKENISNIGIEYGIAILTYNFIDKTEGKQLLLSFLNKFDNQIYQDKIKYILNTNPKSNNICKSSKSKRKRRKKKKRKKK